MLKEWRSKKELRDFLMEMERDEIIGWVSHKTLKKWDEEIDWHQPNEEDIIFKFIINIFESVNFVGNRTFE